MIEPEKRKAVFLLHQEGMSLREISRRLAISRNIVRDIIRQEGAMPSGNGKQKIQLDEELLRQLYEECKGWKQRVLEKLVDEKGVKVTYSTLTRKLRELGLSQREKGRCDQVPDVAGEEMQHDTTVLNVDLCGVPTKLIASSVYLRYSKRRYLKFYRVFNRFKMKCFLHEALMHWGYAPGICVIDNTNLARLRGTGSNAVIVPEMATFSKQYGFKFVCHEKGHANRKAGEERSFWTMETNFLPGRTFRDVEDLNAQAFQWATVRMYHRPVGKIRLVPVKAFEHEQSYLNKLSPHIPAPYVVHERGTDQYGYAAFGGNFYWVPGTGRQDVRLLERSDQLAIYCARKLLMEYALPAEGVKNKRFSPEGIPRPSREPRNRKGSTLEEEKRLRAMGLVVGTYLDFALKPNGKERSRFVRELYRLCEQMTAVLFLKTIERAAKYSITTIEVLKRIAVLYLSEGDAALPTAEVDENLQSREAYVEGYLTDAPDFSTYDDLLESDDG